MQVATWIVCRFEGDTHVECERCGEVLKFVLPQKALIFCALLKDFYIDHMHCGEVKAAA